MTKHSHIPSECEVVSCQVQATCRYLNFLTAFLLPLCCKESVWKFTIGDIFKFGEVIAVLWCKHRGEKVIHTFNNAEIIWEGNAVNIKWNEIVRPFTHRFLKAPKQLGIVVISKLNSQVIDVVSLRCITRFLNSVVQSAISHPQEISVYSLCLPEKKFFLPTELKELPWNPGRIKFIVVPTLRNTLIHCRKE